MPALAENLDLDPGAPRAARDLIEPFSKELSEPTFYALRQVVAEVLAACVESEIRAHRALLRVVPTERDLVVEVGFNSDASNDIVRGFRAHDPVAASIAFRLVDRLADRWVVRDDGAWTTVWVLLPLARRPRPPERPARQPKRCSAEAARPTGERIPAVGPHGVSGSSGKKGSRRCPYQRLGARRMADRLPDVTGQAFSGMGTETSRRAANWGRRSA